MKQRATSGEQLRIRASEVRTKPDFTKTAPALLDRCRSFYQDPENEKAFQEWKARRERKAC